MNIPFADRLLYHYIRHRYHQGSKVAPLDSLQLHTVNRVLLVLTTGLGDTILSTPVFPAVRRALPGADIRLLCRKNWLELFTDDPNINGFFPYHGKYRQLFRTLNALRNFEPQLTLILHGNDPDIIPIAYLSGSRYIVRIPWKQTRFPFLLSNTGRVQDAETLPDTHYISNRLRILDTVGIKPDELPPKIFLSPELLTSVRQRLINMFGGESNYFIFHAFAADRFKVWPEKKSRAFLETVLQVLPDYRIMLTGAAWERKDINRIAGGLPDTRIFNMAGELSLREVAACVAGADFLIGPDTGILYLAAALDIPTIALYAPTSPDVLHPGSLRVAHHLIQKPQTCSPCLYKGCPYDISHCMDQISVEDVLDKVILAAARGRNSR